MHTKSFLHGELCVITTKYGASVTVVKASDVEVVIHANDISAAMVRESLLSLGYEKYTLRGFPVYNSSNDFSIVVSEVDSNLFGTICTRMSQLLAESEPPIKVVFNCFLWAIYSKIVPSKFSRITTH